MKAQAVIADLARRGIRLIPNPPKLTVQGASRLTHEDRKLIRQLKAEILAALRSEAADTLAILHRLKGFTVPAGRVRAARAIMERLRPLLTASELDPAQALAALQTAEAELTVLGGIPNRKLSEVVAIVATFFPDARLVAVRKPP